MPVFRTTRLTCFDFGQLTTFNDTSWRRGSPKPTYTGRIKNGKLSQLYHVLRTYVHVDTGRQY